MRNKDAQTVVVLTGDDEGQLQRALEYMFNTYGVAKLEDVMIFVSNKEIMNYQSFFTVVNVQDNAHVEEQEEGF